MKTNLKKSKNKIKSGSKEGKGGDSPSRLIDARIKELGDWRGETLARVRSLIKQADPEAVEEWKWRGVPVWSHAGIICTGETYKNAVKVTFAEGASLNDPSGLFNSSLEGNTRRAIDFHEGDTIDAEAFQALVHADDIVQEVLLRAWKHPNVLDQSESSARAWLFTVARNLVFDEHRSARSQREIGMSSTPERAAPDSSDGALDAWMMGDALARLSPDHRAALVLGYY